MITEDKEGSGFSYNEKEAVNTVAGCINSVHDLMGMIITEEEGSAEEKDSKDIEEKYNPDYIYYLKNDRKYYRRYKDYEKEEIDYKYIPVAVDE